MKPVENARIMLMLIVQGYKQHLDKHVYMDSPLFKGFVT